MPESDVFNDLAYEFAERFRRGERPSLTEYTDRYPELADDIRELFPALVMMEHLGSGGDRLADQATGRFQHGRPIPERVGDFRIIREIGRGGMGIVYEAEQESLGRHVALKVLSHARQLEPIQLIRFQREARAAALLHHTNIVPVFGVGVHEDVHYYAMQYIQGQGLDSVLRELIRLRQETVQEGTIPHLEPDNLSASLASGLLTNRLQAGLVLADAGTIFPSPTAQTIASSPGTARKGDTVSLSTDVPSSSTSILGHKEAKYFRSVARLGMQAAEALAYAHSHDVVHRDIKPANLLLDLQGTIWVTDFGLAKVQGHEELTSPGDVVGTLRYMAPERFQGKVDGRCDVYSLGVTLYELLTLKPAFTASHRVQLINSILHTEPQRPRRVDPQIPRDLETIVLKAIAKNPSDRLATAREMATELGRFVDGRPIRSRRASVPERVWRWSRRNPAVALLTLLAASLTTVLAIGSTVAAWRFHEQRDEVVKEQQNTQGKLSEALLLQAQSLRFSRRLGHRAEGLERLADAARIPQGATVAIDHREKLRDELIATLAEVDEQQVETWPGINIDWFRSSFAFDANRYVVLDNGNSLHLHRFPDRTQLRAVKSKNALGWPILCPSGRFVIAWTFPSGFEFWDMERGEVPPAWPADVRCATFRPDGKQVAALLSDGEVRVFDLPAMTESRRCHLGLRIPSAFGRQSMALSRDGRRLAVMRQKTKDAWVLDLTNDRILVNVKIPPVSTHGSLALSSKGTLLAVAHDRTISVYDVRAGERLTMLHGHPAAGINSWFEPKGDLLVSECWDGMTRLWDPIRGSLLAALPGQLRGLMESDSKIVVGRKDDLIVYQMDQGKECRTIDCRKLQEQPDPAIYGPARVAFSPDGTMIAMGFRPEGVRILRTGDGVQLAHLPIGDCDEVSYLPDGSLLTFNDRGLCRWPVRPLSDRALRIGPPEPLAPSKSTNSGWIAHGLVSNPSGRLLGVVAWAPEGCLLLDTERPWRRIWLKPQGRVYDLAISPDGRWAATAGVDGPRGNERVRVWDAATGELRREIPGYSCAAFSPDGQWLGVNDQNGYRFFETRSWTPVCRFDHNVVDRLQEGAMRIAFHPVGHIAAIMDADWTTVRLVNLRTRRQIASLKGAEDSQAYCISFSSDGRFLAASRYDNWVHVWDLALIRQRLKELDLVAGFPDVFDGGATAGDSPQIDRIDVYGADLSGLTILAARQTLREAWIAFRGLLEPGLTDAEELRRRGDVWDRLGGWRMAAADYRASLSRRPQSALTANSLAWSLASIPGRGDADEAIRWVRKAVELESANADYRNTLGVALYRAGRFAEAAEELERNTSRHPRFAGYDWVFLAMSRQRLGQPSASRSALTRAIEWRARAHGLAPAQSAEFHAFLLEAQAVLGERLPDFPPDDFDR
jgi:serine/threonine protein kinase/WD40 repeat protein